MFKGRREDSSARRGGTVLLMTAPGAPLVWDPSSRKPPTSSAASVPRDLTLRAANAFTSPGASSLASTGQELGIRIEAKGMLLHLERAGEVGPETCRRRTDDRW